MYLPSYLLKFPGCDTSLWVFSYLPISSLNNFKLQSLCRVKEELIDSLLRMVEVSQDARMRGGDEDRGRAPHPPASAETGNCHNKWITWPDETISSNLLLLCTDLSVLPGISFLWNCLLFAVRIKCIQRLNVSMIYVYSQLNYFYHGFGKLSIRNKNKGGWADFYWRIEKM